MKIKFLALSVLNVRHFNCLETFWSPEWSEGGQPCCFLLDCILAITCQVLQCRSQVEGLRGVWRTVPLCPRGVPFTTLYDTELYFIKVRIVDAALKVVAGEIRPSGSLTRSAGWENVFLFKLNPSESNHFFFLLSFFFFLGGIIQSDIRHQLSKEGFTIYLCWFLLFFFLVDLVFSNK